MATAVDMQIRSVLSTDNDTAAAVEEVCGALAGMNPDLAILFSSHHHLPELDELCPQIGESINARNLIGCTGEGVIGPDREVEQSPGLVLWAARLPGVRSLPFLLDQEDLGQLDSPEAWHERLGVRPEDRPSFVILPEPFSIDVDRCLRQLDAAFHGSVVVGGVASGANGPGQNRLFLNDQPLRQGLVGVSLCGPVRIDTVVSQGCRPIGKPFVVTKAQENLIAELGGRPALQVLHEVLQGASPEDQALVQKGLMIGRVVNESLHEFRRGDFLIRNVIGVVGNSALAVNELIRPGQTVQFHVRDSGTASEEMSALLASQGETAGSPIGGLLFSCNGRGRNMFDKANHDIGAVNRAFGPCAVGGFFAAGEIGPVGNRSFIHGFTSSVILFSRAREAG